MLCKNGFKSYALSIYDDNLVWRGFPFIQGFKAFSSVWLSCFQLGRQWLYVQPVSGLPVESAKNVSDSAKSNYWVLVCRCWKLVSILTFRKGVITDRGQRILKISLACPYEAGSFVVILLECLTEGSRESSSLLGSKACLTKRAMHRVSKCGWDPGIPPFSGAC